MAWSSSDLVAIEAAIASGQLSVRYSDREVRYQSTADLLRARDAIKADLAAQSAASSGGKIVRQVLMRQGCRGY